MRTGRWVTTRLSSPSTDLFTRPLVRVILVRECGSDKPYDIALVTTDLQASAEAIVGRYARRWLVEQSIKDGKDLFGASDPQNRLPKAVQRTVPFAMLAQTIPLLWYATPATPKPTSPPDARARPGTSTRSTPASTTCSSRSVAPEYRRAHGPSRNRTNHRHR